MEIPIRGMTCDHCVRNVTTALRSVPGVKSVKVDLRTGVAQVEGEPNLQALALAIAATGYQAVI